MNKLVTLCLLLLFIGAPLQAQERTNDQKKKDSVRRPLLNDLRKKNAVKYKEARNRLRTQPKSVQVYRFQRCTPCDTRFVASLLKKDKLTKAEIRNLICTNQPKCRANAEFREIFNEVIHKAIASVPDRFYDTYEEEGQRKYLTELDEEILNPNDDRITNEAVLKSLKARLQKRANSANQPVMLKRLEGKLESRIQIRQADLIKRKALIRQQGG